MSSKTVLSQVRALECMTVAELAAEHERVVGKPPRTKQRDHLRRVIAWAIQAAALGGLTEDTEAPAGSVTDTLDIPVRRPQRARKRRRRNGELALGTVIVRPYKGNELRVTVVDGGFEYDGIVYTSLSAVARAVTGSKWNGKLFFGFTPRANRR